MKKLAFYLLGFCLIPFYLLRNLKLFPSSSVFWNWNTPPLSTTTACATTRTADHQHRPETTTTGGETSQASYQETPWGSTLEKSKSMIFSNLNGGQSDLQRRIAKALDKFEILKFDVGAAINSKEVDVARCFELSWCVSSWRKSYLLFTHIYRPGGCSGSL